MEQIKCVEWIGGWSGAREQCHILFLMFRILLLLWISVHMRVCYAGVQAHSHIRPQFLGTRGVFINLLLFLPIIVSEFFFFSDARGRHNMQTNLWAFTGDSFFTLCFVSLLPLTLGTAYPSEILLSYFPFFVFGIQHFSGFGRFYLFKLIRHWIYTWCFVIDDFSSDFVLASVIVRWWRSGKLVTDKRCRDGFIPLVGMVVYPPTN